jgi:4-hydroxy-2-oxoheptanedioate aldolase
MGIIVNNVETARQAENIVRTMRYMQQRDSKIPIPQGVRGTAGNGPWFWGIPGDEYRRRADLWPLNPQGDLVFWPMIETTEGVKNADAIARVPGVGGFYLGAAGDLSNSLGVPNSDHPDVDAAMAKILSVCKARNIPCGGTVTATNAAAMMKQGYRMVNFGGANGGLTAQNDAARRAAIAAGANR